MYHLFIYFFNTVIKPRFNILIAQENIHSELQNLYSTAQFDKKFDVLFLNRIGVYVVLSQAFA